jgi:hypothetical protein
MLIEGNIASKHLAAIFANVRLLPSVLSPVNLQEALLYKGFVTHVTFVRSDSMVEFFMHDQRSLKSLNLNIINCTYVEKKNT